MFENIIKTIKKLIKKEQQHEPHSKDTAKERLHLVLMQDRANVSADFLELMKQEIIDVIKKYIEVEEDAIDVRLTNKIEEDGTTGAPFLYANIPVVNIKSDFKKEKANVGVDALGDPKENAAKPEKKDDVGAGPVSALPEEEPPVSSADSPLDKGAENAAKPEKKDKKDDVGAGAEGDPTTKKDIHGIKKQDKNYKKVKDAKKDI